MAWGIAMIRYIPAKPYKVWDRIIVMYVANNLQQRYSIIYSTHENWKTYKSQRPGVHWLHLQRYWDNSFPSYYLWAYISYLLLKLVTYLSVHYLLFSRRFLFYQSRFIVAIIVYMFNDSYTIPTPFTTSQLFTCAKQLVLIRIVYWTMDNYI